ncbi:MAG: GNAT family N-acetyltransferase [Chloroflexota bacterium]|jgi:RimJ/RimL family protein N-acetyltransferase|nr:GNAT family N-acetyltransferase [Chloroflexota bacterium]
MSQFPTALPTLHTSRLTIRPFTVDDAEAYHAIVRATFGSTKTLAQHRQRLQWLALNEAALAELVQPPYGDRAIVLRDSNQLIGAMGFVPSLGPFAQLTCFAHESPADQAQRFTPEVGLFWMIDPAHQRNGYASEAAQALIEYAGTGLNLRRIIATTEYDNAASIAVMHKLGMSIDHNPLPTPAWFQVVGVFTFS